MLIQMSQLTNHPTKRLIIKEIAMNEKDKTVAAEKEYFDFVLDQLSGLTEITYLSKCGWQYACHIFKCSSKFALVFTANQGSCFNHTIISFTIRTCSVSHGWRLDLSREGC